MIVDFLEYFLVLVLVIIVVAGVWFALTLEEENSAIETNQTTTETGITYSYFTIDGMPCVYVEVGAGRTATGGPSCDWTKWKGGQ